jgi:hypothetical protein
MFRKLAFSTSAEYSPHDSVRGQTAPADEGQIARLRRFLPAIAFILCLANGRYLIDAIGRTPDNDFSKAYWSTVVFLRGGDMYGINPSTQCGEWNGKPIFLWNLNPPHFHLIILPFAVLPIYPALALWLLINILCLYFSLRAIRHELQLTETQWQFTLVGVLAFAGTTASLLSVHCSFLLMFLVTRMWLAARQERFTSAGLYLGVAMSVKPFLLMLLPYFLLRRRWKTFFAAITMSLICFALGAAVFGVDALLAWREKLSSSTSWCWQFQSGSLYGLLARTLTRNPMGECLFDCPPSLVPLLWLALGVPIGLVTLAVSCIEKAPAEVDRSLSILLVASLLLSPLGWAYYFCLPLGPIAAVVQNWWRSEANATRASRVLLLAAALGLVCPLSLCRLFQPSALATVLLGNLYSYCVLAVWVALLLDGVRSFRIIRWCAGRGSLTPSSGSIRQ